MKRGIRALAAVALLSASGAWAVAKGGKLYIKAKGVKLLKEGKATAPTIPGAKELAVGEAVTWLGPAADKQFHEIEVGGKKGFTLMANLSPAEPMKELAGKQGEPISAQSFASSGAATKGLTPAGVKYSKNSGGAKDAEAAAQVIYVEEFNKAKGTAAAVLAKAKELGGGK